jgi:hypothetical protein
LYKKTSSQKTLRHFGVLKRHYLNFKVLTSTGAIQLAPIAPYGISGNLQIQLMGILRFLLFTITSYCVVLFGDTQLASVQGIVAGNITESAAKENGKSKQKAWAHLISK